MSSVPVSAEVGQVRPSRLIAEALVNHHDSYQVISRAEQLGLSPDLTEAVIAVCCCDKRPSDDAWTRIKADISLSS